MNWTIINGIQVVGNVLSNCPFQLHVSPINHSCPKLTKLKRDWVVWTPTWVRTQVKQYLNRSLFLKTGNFPQIKYLLYLNYLRFLLRRSSLFFLSRVFQATDLSIGVRFKNTKIFCDSSRTISVKILYQQNFNFSSTCDVWLTRMAMGHGSMDENWPVLIRY